MKILFIRQSAILLLLEWISFIDFNNRSKYDAVCI